MGGRDAADPRVAPPLADPRAIPLVSQSSASATPERDPLPDPLLGRSRYCLSHLLLPAQSALVMLSAGGCYADVPAFLMLLVPLCLNSTGLPSDLSLLVSSFFPDSPFYFTTMLFQPPCTSLRCEMQPVEWLETTLSSEGKVTV